MTPQAMKQSLVICTVCHTAFASVGVDLPNMPHCPRCGAHMGALAVRERAAGPAIGVTPERRCLSRHTTRIPRRHSRR
ncbi:MAG: hypothetical protein IT463_13545 [Planctomycetes bacterium]|nr:hypothetical protein [Planctomycetota bacterium]